MTNDDPLSKNGVEIAPGMYVRSSDTAQERLNYLNRVKHMPFRQIALLDSYRGIPAGTLSTIAKTGIVPDKWCARLGVPRPASVVVVFGEVPEGAQVIGARRCGCGQYFIPNHPRRQRCFMCSPFRGG